MRPKGWQPRVISGGFGKLVEVTERGHDPGGGGSLDDLRAPAVRHLAPLLPLPDRVGLDARFEANSLDHVPGEHGQTCGQVVRKVKDKLGADIKRPSRLNPRMEPASLTEFYAKVRERLVAERKKLNDASQADIAARLGVDKDTYSKMEQRGRPPLDMLPGLCGVFGITAWYLLTGRNVEEHLADRTARIPKVFPRVPRGRPAAKVTPLHKAKSRR